MDSNMMIGYAICWPNCVRRCRRLCYHSNMAFDDKVFGQRQPRLFPQLNFFVLLTKCMVSGSSALAHVVWLVQLALVHLAVFFSERAMVLQLKMRICQTLHGIIVLLQTVASCGRLTLKDHGNDNCLFLLLWRMGRWSVGFVIHGAILCAS